MKDWLLVYEGFDPKMEGLREALCTLGNGYFATRGAAPESAADNVHYPGTYLAGGYNRLETKIAGRIIENEDLVNLPNWLPLSFRIEDDDWFDLRTVEILSCRQELNLKEGVLERTVRFRDKKGRSTTLTQRRIVSMAQPHLAALETSWLPENWSGCLEIRSALDGRIINCGVPRYRDLNDHHLMPLATGRDADDIVYIKVKTSQSDLHLAQAARLRLFQGDERIKPKVRCSEDPGWIAQLVELEATAGRAVKTEKIVSLFTGRDPAISECGLAARQDVANAAGFEQLLASHAQAWRRLWDRFDMELEFSTPEEAKHRTSLILHLHIFHLLQVTSPHTMDLDVGVPSRGWHGEAYRGHIFWDELFIFPLLNLRVPDITRSLMKYRHRRLGAARRAACEAGFRGAMYPWQSGSDGREESQAVHLNPKSGRWLPDHSRLQRHVNAAIAHNIWQYFQVSGDLEFLCFHGAEMILEIARFWAGLVTEHAPSGRYEILGVMGPDEYHEKYPGADKPGLNNNTYTNVMAVWVFCRALELFQLLPEEHAARIRQQLELKDEEIRRWDDISRKMRLVFLKDGILSQFEGYDELEEFDWDKYRRRYGETMRLDRILEAESDTPNRYKASKQADVLMLFYLFSTEELSELFTRLGYGFDPQMIPKNVEYYLQRTSNGSTLSEVVSAWVLARTDRHRSWKLFTDALQSDFADIQGGTTSEGIHLGAMAGTVDLIQRCYLGLETRQHILWLNPRLPEKLARLRVRIRYRQASLSLDATHEVLKIHAIHCPIEALHIGFGDRIIVLRENDEVELNLNSPKPPLKPTGPTLAEAPGGS